MDVKINLQDGKLVHEQKLKDRKQSISSDSASIAWYIVRQKLEAQRESESSNSEPEDVIRKWSEEGQRQWTYALVEDEKYVHEVEHKASSLVKKILYDIEHNKGKLVSLYPPAATAPGGAPGGEAGGGEGLAGLFGRKKKNIVILASPTEEAFLYNPLIPTESRTTIYYWASVLNLPIPNPDGDLRTFRLSSDEVISVPSGQATELNRVVDNIRATHTDVFAEVFKVLREMSVPEGTAREMASGCFHWFETPDRRGPKNLILDIVSTMMDGAFEATISRMSKSPSNRSRIVLQAIGRAFYPTMSKIASLVNKAKDKEIVMESPAPTGHFYVKDTVVATVEYVDNNISGNNDILSLVATIKSHTNTSHEKQMALFRLGRLFALNPRIFEQEGITPELISKIYQQESAKDMIRLMMASKMSDAQLGNEYTLFPPIWRPYVATLIATQNRTKLIESAPTLWYTTLDNKMGSYAVSKEFFLKSDKSNPDNLVAIKSVLRNQNECHDSSAIMMNNSEAIDYVKHALWEGRNNSLAREMLYDHKSSTEAFCFLCENGDEDDFRLLAEFVSRSTPSQSETPNPAHPSDKYMWASVMQNATKIKETPLYQEILKKKFEIKWAVDEIMSGSHLCTESQQREFSKTFKMTPSGKNLATVIEDAKSDISKEAWGDLIMAFIDLNMMDEHGQMLEVLRMILRVNPPLKALSGLFKDIHLYQINTNGMDDVFEKNGYQVNGNQIAKIRTPNELAMEGALYDEMVVELSKTNPGLVATNLLVLYKKNPQEAKRVIGLMPAEGRGNVSQYIPNWAAMSKATDVEANASGMTKTAQSRWSETPETKYFYLLATGMAFPSKDGTMSIVYHGANLTSAQLDEAVSKIMASHDRDVALRIFGSMRSGAEQASKNLFRNEEQANEFASLAMSHSWLLPFFLEAKESGPMGMLLVRSFGASDTTKKAIKEWAELSGSAVDDIADLSKKMGFQIVRSPNWPGHGGLTLRGTGEDVEWRTWGTEPMETFRSINYGSSHHLPSLRHSMANINSSHPDALSEMSTLVRSVTQTLALFPEYYERNGIPEEDIDRYRSSFPALKTELDFLSKMSRGINSDDAYLMELWANDNDTKHKKMVADLAAKQRRMAIVMGNPTMWYVNGKKAGDGDVSQAFFELSDMRNHSNVDKVMEMMDYLNPKGMERMIYSALIRSESKELANRISNPKVRREYGLEAPDVTCALMAIDANDGDDELHAECMRALSSMARSTGISRTPIEVITLMPPTRQADEFLEIIRNNTLSISNPADVWLSSYVAGKKQFSRFSKATGLSSMGKPISEMISDPGLLDYEVKSLLSDLENNGDVVNIIRLFRTEVKKKDKAKPSVFKGALEACERMGIGDKASKVLIEEGLEIHGDKVFSPEVPSSEYFNQMPLPMALSVLERVISKDKASAISLLKGYPPGKIGELLSYLPPAMRTGLSTPSWAENRDVEATILPNGKVILG